MPNDLTHINATPALLPSAPPTTPLTSLHAGVPEWQIKPVRQSREAQNALTMLLSQLYATQKAYGEKAEMLGLTDAIYQELLGRYDYARVRWAFLEYIKAHPDMPAPADIINLISEKRWNALVL